MKKLLTFTFILIFAIQGIGFAAVSSSTRTSPAPRPSTTQTAPSTSSGYKPSAPANSYSQTAPATNSTPSTAAQQPASGGFMRNLGYLGSGMLLGSLLGGFFGPHSGLGAIAGLLINILFLGGIIVAGRFLWEKFKQRKDDQR